MNALTFPLLRFLSDGRIHGVAEIGDMLGVSATEVAATLNELLSMGLKIERVEGGGCRLTTPLAWLDANEITDHLGGHASVFQIEVVDHTG